MDEQVGELTANPPRTNNRSLFTRRRRDNTLTITEAGETKGQELETASRHKGSNFKIKQEIKGDIRNPKSYTEADSGNFYFQLSMDSNTKL